MATVFEELDSYMKDSRIPNHYADEIRRTYWLKYHLEWVSARVLVEQFELLRTCADGREAEDKCQQELHKLGEQYPKQRVKGAKWIFKQGLGMDALLMVTRSSVRDRYVQRAKEILARCAAEGL